MLMSKGSKSMKLRFGKFRKIHGRRSLEDVQSILAMFPEQEKRSNPPRDSVTKIEENERSSEEDKKSRSPNVADT